MRRMLELARAALAAVLVTSCCGYDDAGPPWEQG